jgi:hypothetical protein
MWNILILGTGFVIAMITLLLVVFANMDWNLLSWLFMLSFLSALPFTHITFHINQKKPYWAIYLIGGLLYVLKIYYAYQDYYNRLQIDFLISSLLEAIIILFSFGWLGNAVLQAYSIIKRDKIESWIKARFMILGIVSWIIAFQGITQILWPIFGETIGQASPLTLSLLTISTIMSVLFALGNILVWLFPNLLKKLFKDSQKKTPQKNI